MFFFEDRPLPAELQELLDAASILDIGEFRLFELAYRDWYGTDADASRLEHDYARYMFGDDVPIWVRHYVRGVLKQAKQPQSCLPHPVRFPQPPQHQSATAAGIQRGLRIFLGLIFILVFLIVVISLSPEWLLFGNECYFPPCY